VKLFQATITEVVALAVFMPIVAGMGGNAATQTLTVIVRGIALGELTWSNSRKALLKEGLVGIGNGVALGLVAALGAWALQGDPMLGVILALAMIINMFVAATAGTLIPLSLRALKVDPALASSVFITTLTDVFGFFSFLGLATLFIRYLQLTG
jgi:magnesium transporter